jgi:D-glycero-D-manno-heptose 1,7-bisphosphate phosphatase
MFLINEALPKIRHTTQSRNFVFLDRDGVINLDSGYVGHWRDFKFIEGALEALSTICANNFEIVVVTNQSGIGRGLYSEQEFLNLSTELFKFLNQRKIYVQSIQYCPHYIFSKQPQYAQDCDCRKPKPGMIHNAASIHGIDLSRASMVGDKLTDVIAARAAKVGKSFLITPSSTSDDALGFRADGYFPNLLACTPALLRNGQL